MSTRMHRIHCAPVPSTSCPFTPPLCNKICCTGISSWTKLPLWPGNIKPIPHVYNTTSGSPVSTRQTTPPRSRPYAPTVNKQVAFFQTSHCAIKALHRLFSIKPSHNHMFSKRAAVDSAVSFAVAAFTVTLHHIAATLKPGWASYQELLPHWISLSFFGIRLGIS